MLYAPTLEHKAAFIRSHGAQVQAVLTNGATGLVAADIDALPFADAGVRPRRRP